MSSMLRNLQRKKLRQVKITTDNDGNTVRVEHEPQPQRTIGMKDGGYVTVRYTKGYQAVSASRLRAQARLAAIQQPGAMREQMRVMSRAMNGPAVKPLRQWQVALAFDRALIPLPAGTITRQQIRFARSHGLPIPVVEAAPKPKRKRAAKPAPQAAA